MSGIRGGGGDGLGGGGDGGGDGGLGGGLGGGGDGAGGGGCFGGDGGGGLGGGGGGGAMPGGRGGGDEGEAHVAEAEVTLLGVLQQLPTATISPLPTSRSTLTWSPYMLLHHCAQYSATVPTPSISVMHVSKSSHCAPCAAVNVVGWLKPFVL